MPTALIAPAQRVQPDLFSAWPDEPLALDLDSYDKIIVAFSGGKDSVACVLMLLESGVPASAIELWHHDVDGREGSRLMDWPCTAGYCRAFAEAFGLRLYFSWRVGGFERELLKTNDRLAGASFETPDGVLTAGGERGSIATRRMFPQVSPDLSVRWCSRVVKIDVFAIALNNQPRFRGKRVLVVTGERAGESKARENYKVFEAHRCDARAGRLARHVDHCRPVHGWSEKEVWAIMRRHGVVAHACYFLGYSRASCAACVFSGPDQLATLLAINPAQFQQVADHEADFGVTIHRGETIVERAARGVPFDCDPEMIRRALSDVWDAPIVVPPDQWRLPAGAFKGHAGPS